MQNWQAPLGKNSPSFTQDLSAPRRGLSLVGSGSQAPSTLQTLQHLPDNPRAGRLTGLLALGPSLKPLWYGGVLSSRLKSFSIQPAGGSISMVADFPAPPGRRFLPDQRRGWTSLPEVTHVLFYFA